MDLMYQGYVKCFYYAESIKASTWKVCSSYSKWVHVKFQPHWLSASRYLKAGFTSVKRPQGSLLRYVCVCGYVFVVFVCKAVCDHLFLNVVSIIHKPLSPQGSMRYICSLYSCLCSYVHIYFQVCVRLHLWGMHVCVHGCVWKCVHLYMSECVWAWLCVWQDWIT